MASSRAAEFIDAIYEALAAESDLTDAGVQVIDGPLVTDSTSMKWVFVGYDGNAEGEFEAVNTTQEWAGLGKLNKNEADEVTCSVVVTSGDTTAIKSCRDEVYTILSIVEDVLREDPSLGFSPPTVVELTAATLYQEQIAGGIQARLPFTVSATTRI